MTQKEPGGIVALTAQAQQILVQAQRQIQFAAVYVINRLPMGNVKELRGGTQLLPQLSCAGKGMACFRRRIAFDGSQHRAQLTAKFEPLSPIFEVVRQQRQLVQPLFKLRGRFCRRRAGGAMRRIAVAVSSSASSQVIRCHPGSGSPFGRDRRIG